MTQEVSYRKCKNLLKNKIKLHRTSRRRSEYKTQYCLIDLLIETLSFAKAFSVGIVDCINYVFK